MKKLVYSKVDSKIVDELIEKSNSESIEQFEGNLLDNYIIDNINKLVFNSSKARKYIVIKEKFLNEWSSCYDVIFTDEEKEVDEFRNLMTE